jgi:hypothetical protein
LNSGNEKFNNSNKKTQLSYSLIEWNKLKIEYQDLKTR